MILIQHCLYSHAFYLRSKTACLVEQMHTITVLLDNYNFMTSNVHCLFTNIASYLLVHVNMFLNDGESYTNNLSVICF